jgi:hypothetical protein
LAKELHPGLRAAKAHGAIGWLVAEYQRARAGEDLSVADFVARQGDALRRELAQRYGTAE